MRKLKLDLEQLAVETFDTAVVQGARGTVKGHEQYTYFCDTEECTGNGASCVWSRCYTCESCHDETVFTCP